MGTIVISFNLDLLLLCFKIVVVPLRPLGCASGQEKKSSMNVRRGMSAAVNADQSLLWHGKFF